MRKTVSMLAFAGVILALWAGVARAQSTAVPFAPISAPETIPPSTTPPRTVYQIPVDPAPGAPAVPPLPPLLPGDRSGVVLPDGQTIPLPSSARQVIRFGQRYGRYINADIQQIGPDSQRLVVTDGLIVNVTYEAEAKPGQTAQWQEIEFATDNAVIWVTGKDAADPLRGLTTGPNEQNGKTKVELFLAGNVVIRTKQETPGATGPTKSVVQTLRAERIFYNVNYNRAIALGADLELAFNGLRDRVRLRGEEIWRLGPEEWRVIKANASASRLPSDPALKLVADEVTFTRREVIRRNIFGIPYKDRKTGEEIIGYEQILTSRNVSGEYMDVPFFYLPYLRTDANDPLGPLMGVGFGNDRIFGFQAYTTWDMHKLLAIRPPSGHRWKLHLDYLSDRGPGFGTDYLYQNSYGFLNGLGPPPEGHPFYEGNLSFDGPNKGELKFYGIPDGGTDVLGNFRGAEPNQAGFRGRALWFHDQDLYDRRDTFLRLQTQFAYLSDKNFFEQYYKQEFDTGRNQETYAYVYGANGNLGGSLLAQGNINRPWVTETQWLPKAEGYLLGESFFDGLLSYNARGSAGYARFHPSTQPAFPIQSTDTTKLNTGRLNLNQELSAPLDLGPFRVTPYGVLDLTGYSEDLKGDSTGRIAGGGGSRISLPVSRLYEDANSELFNLRGLNHKVTFGANYYFGRANKPYTDFPQLDRLNDDSLDLGHRTMRPLQPLYSPGGAGVALASSPIFDPQRYAIRRLVDNRVDTIDDMQVVQADIRQRLQTKRGFPGAEHVVDWLSWDVSASFFPQASKDNFGKSAAFLESSLLWNIGDRTAIAGSAWLDPFDFGSRYYTVGTMLNRPDGTSFYLGYRQIDPVNSKAVTAAVNYQLSRRYSVNFVSTYDFGTNLALSNSLNFVRVGTDITLAVGLTYNALLNNFGAQLIIVPNLAALFGLNRVGVPALGAR